MPSPIIAPSARTFARSRITIFPTCSGDAVSSASLTVEGSTSIILAARSNVIIGAYIELMISALFASNRFFFRAHRAQ
jgi:hypothetical protein